MSRIDDIKKEIERHENNIKHGQSVINSNKAPLESFRKELSALEAREKGPMTFTVSRHRDGKWYCTPHNLTIGDGSNPEILVREVKPIVVTREMAKNGFDKWASKNYGDVVESMVAFLSAFNIDAEPSND